MEPVREIPGDWTEYQWHLLHCSWRKDCQWAGTQRSLLLTWVNHVGTKKVCFEEIEYLSAPSCVLLIYPWMESSLFRTKQRRVFMWSNVPPNRFALLPATKWVLWNRNIFICSLLDKMKWSGLKAKDFQVHILDPSLGGSHCTPAAGEMWLLSGWMNQLLWFSVTIIRVNEMGFGSALPPLVSESSLHWLPNKQSETVA